VALRDGRSDVLELDVSDGSDPAVVRATGEVDVMASACLRPAPARLVGAGRPLVVDLRGVRVMGPSGIGVLVGAHRLARSSGLAFTLRRSSPTVARLLETSGVLSMVAMERNPPCPAP
jgi:anti-anti-sigma factor